MALTRREFLGGAAVFMATAMAGGLVGCGSFGSTSSSSTGNTATTESVDLSADKWSYDATNNVYCKSAYRSLRRPGHHGLQ